MRNRVSYSAWSALWAWASGASAGRTRRSCSAEGAAGGYKGIAYLHRTQETDGSWGRYPATTALALSAFLRNGKNELKEPAVAKGVQFLLAGSAERRDLQQRRPAMALPNYNTCLAVMTLALTRNPAYTGHHSQGAAVS